MAQKTQAAEASNGHGGGLSQQEPTGAEGNTTQPTCSGQFRWERCLSVGFPHGSAVENLPAVQERQETRVRSLGREDPLKEGMETHSSILAWRIPWTEKPGGLQSIGSQRVGHNLGDLAGRQDAFLGHSWAREAVTSCAGISSAPKMGSTWNLRR